MSNVDYARSRLYAHRVGGIVSFLNFTLECARRYYNDVSSWPDRIGRLRSRVAWPNGRSQSPTGRAEQFHARTLAGLIFRADARAVQDDRA